MLQKTCTTPSRVNRTARLEPGDAGEDAAASEIAGLCAGVGLRLTAAHTGRCNIEAATAGVEFENTGSEPLVGLRYFGPDTHANVPQIGD